MTPRKPTKEAQLVNLPWEGASTVEAAVQAVGGGCEVEIVLPANMHYVVLRHLNPDAAPGTPYALDLAGGAELIERLAGVANLDPLAPLAPAVRDARYRVRVVSPSPVLCLYPPNSGSEP